MTENHATLAQQSPHKPTQPFHLGESDQELLVEFSKTRNDQAFAELVRRHGPLVFGVCRRVLGSTHAAEDAFQNVFLILARKSNLIRQPELLGNWLYGVAYRVSKKARTKKLRDLIRDRAGAHGPLLHEPNSELELAELKKALDDEVSQLPKEFRDPLLLCYFQGKTNAQAAAQLGWPSGSISDRLSQTREMLRRRLKQRGIQLAVPFLLAWFTANETSAAVSDGLMSWSVASAVSAKPDSWTDLINSHWNSAGKSNWSTAEVVRTSALTLAIIGSLISLGFSQGVFQDLAIRFSRRAEPEYDVFYPNRFEEGFAASCPKGIVDSQNIALDNSDSAPQNELASEPLNAVEDFVQ